uniref:histidine kinase n=1 Tax=Ningiella ruwaisensis TaxID=2364274 RepID=UPI00109FB296|nr:histidine kinase [Ningiella ruwaisensis]
MSDLSKQIHDARRPLNNISMQAELIKMLSDESEQAEGIQAAADKIIQYCQQCSEQLQVISQAEP